MSAANSPLRALPSPRKSTAQMRTRGLRTPAFVTPAMMRRLKTYGTTEFVERDKLLFQQGERLVDFFIVVEGKLELYEQKGRASREVEIRRDKKGVTGGTFT
jgi:CRP-like cAMP-binding protein